MEYDGGDDDDSRHHDCPTLDIGASCGVSDTEENRKIIDLERGHVSKYRPRVIQHSGIIWDGSRVHKTK